jgi:hypothetical protein
MIALRRITWIVPISLGALTATLIVAIFVARSERPSRALIAATPGILSAAGRGTPPEIAAINAQLAQVAALRAGARYGPGLTRVVGAPVASLRPLLGEEWRELDAFVGRAWVYPSGTPSRYFEVSAVAVAQHGPARLEVLTSEGQRAIEAASAGPFQVLNFGPFLAPARGGVGLALASLQLQSNSPGPRLVLSPLQAEYLRPGEWVTGMPALAEMGPGGLKGVYLSRGSTTRFAMTRGVRGRANLTLLGASVGGALQVTVAVGSEARSAQLNGGPSTVQIGPFKSAETVVSVSVSAPAGGSNPTLFVSNMRLVAARR